MMVDVANNVMQFVNTWGPLGLLALMVLAMLYGWVMPRKSVDELIKATKESSERTAEIMAKEIKDGMGQAVEHGIERGLVRGIMRINEINGGDSQ
jgi:hypothetical protein